jgi:hypothetical protein
MGKFLATEQRYLGRVCNWLGTVDIPTLEIVIFPQKTAVFSLTIAKKQQRTGVA